MKNETLELGCYYTKGHIEDLQIGEKPVLEYQLLVFTMVCVLGVAILQFLRARID